MTQYIGLLCLLLIPVYFLYVLFCAYTSPLKNVPGPLLARFTRVWYLSKVLRGDFEKTNRTLHETYGPVVRIAPTEYSVDDVEAVKVLYGHGTRFIKAPWYYASGNPNSAKGDLFTDRDPVRHASTRRKVAHLYSTTTLLRMEGRVDECIHLLMDRFSELSRTGISFNMQHWLQCYAFDVIGYITVARRFGFLDGGQDKEGMFASLHSYLKYSANVGIFSEWHPVLYKILSIFKLGGMSHMIQFTGARIQARMSGEQAMETKLDSDDDFLSRVLEMHAEDPKKFTFEDVFITCITNIGAGSDTTSISLTGILYHLITNPHVYSKLREEVDDYWNNQKHENSISFQDAHAMPYLQACIKEAMRLHPATGLPLARVVPRGGATINDIYFPEKTIVGVNTWVAHRNRDIFGQDAATFRPERWLTGSKEALSRMERYYLTFGHGSRTCIGKNISLMEMTKLVPLLVRSFDFTLTHPEEELKTENVWFVKQINMVCTVSERVF